MGSFSQRGNTEVRCTQSACRGLSCERGDLVGCGVVVSDLERTLVDNILQLGT